MDIQAKVQDRVTPLAVDSYSVQEDATPLDIGSTTGGLGSVRMSGMDRGTGAISTRSAGLVDRGVQLIDSGGVDGTAFKGRGSVFGRINQVSEAGPRLSVDADGLLAKLNSTVHTRPLYGLHSSYTRVQTYYNKCTNPSLETVTTGYTALPSTTGVAAVTRSNATYSAVVGAYHGRVTWSTGATAYGGGAIFTQTGVTVGDQLYVSWSGGTSRASGQALQLSIQWLNGGGSPISTTTGTAAMTSNAASYVRMKVSGKAPAGTASALIRMLNVSGLSQSANWATGDILLFDALMVSSDDVDYFDGSAAYPNSVWLGTADASSSSNVVYTPVDEGFDATLGNAIRYYLGLVGIAADKVVVDNTVDDLNIAFQPWEANLWTQLKKLCSAYQIELNLRGDILYFDLPYTRQIMIEDNAAIGRTISTAGNATTINVVNYNNRYANDVAYSGDTVISVNVGEVKTSEVSISHFLGTVNNPVPVDAKPELVPSNGYYQIVDSNSAVVSGQWWTDNGGSVMTAIASEDGDRITIRVTGPSANGPYTGPFDIADTNGTARLVLTGIGVFTDPETLTFQTGAYDGDRYEAPTIDNIFVSDVVGANMRGIESAQHAGGPLVTINGSIPFSPQMLGQEFGNVSGSRVFYENAWYRITTSTITPGSIQFEAESATLFNDVTVTYSFTFNEFNAQWPGATFGTYNTAIGAMTFDGANAASSNITFDTLNAIYFDSTFNDHAVYPLMTQRAAELLATG